MLEGLNHDPAALAILREQGRLDPAQTDLAALFADHEVLYESPPCVGHSVPRTPARQTVTLYHGTAHAFDAFEIRGRPGCEPNALLGIHLAEEPSLAAEYALASARDPGAGAPVVLTVEARIGKVGVVGCATDFFGYDPCEDGDSGRRGPDDFARARLRLLSNGFTAIAADVCRDDLAGAWVVLDPAALTVVARTDAESALLDEGFQHAPIDCAYVPVTLHPEAEDAT